LFNPVRLNCSLPGEIPFYYHEVQSASFVINENSTDGVLYAAFTTGEVSEYQLLATTVLVTCTKLY